MNLPDSPPPDILCIGSALWDTIGHAGVHIHLGADVPGRITRRPGGVALNIASMLVRLGLRPALLTAIGRDADGDALVLAAEQSGIDCRYVYLSDLPTDRYLAIEGANGLVAAVADAHSLEAAGMRICAALADGRLGTAPMPWTGAVVLDGNLTEQELSEIAHSPLFAACDMRVAAASPGKAARLRVLLARPRTTLHVNLEEAAILCQQPFGDALAAAAALLEMGANRAIVTDGPRVAADARADRIISRCPPVVLQTRVTGAGDICMAAHLVAERNGCDREDALAAALDAAARHVSGDTP